MIPRIKMLVVNADDLLASLSLIAIVSISVIGVFMRYVLGEPLQWTEEISLALFVWFAFLGSSSVAKRNGHVGIDYFVLKLPPKLQILASIIKQTIIVSVTFIVFVFLGGQLTLQASDKLTPVLGVGYTFIDISVVLGGVLGVIHFTRHILFNLKINKKETPKSESRAISEECKV